MMGIALFFSFVILAAIVLGFLLLIRVSHAEQEAKKEANKMLAEGKIGDRQKFQRIMKILATRTNDLEAADLWKQLQSLEKKTPLS